jgi:hypothetical protein
MTHHSHRRAENQPIRRRSYNETLVLTGDTLRTDTIRTMYYVVRGRCLDPRLNVIMCWICQGSLVDSVAIEQL